MLGGTTTDINLVHIFRAGLTVHGIWVGHRASFETMNRAIEARQMRPVIDRVFPFADAPAAFQYVLDGRHQGKVVVRVA
jgi:NADPH:quinone reductase-like Zn-dependent oxidoreductase